MNNGFSQQYHNSGSSRPASHAFNPLLNSSPVKNKYESYNFNPLSQSSPQRPSYNGNFQNGTTNGYQNGYESYTNGNVRRNFEYEKQRSHNSQQSNNPFAEFEWMGEMDEFDKKTMEEIQNEQEFEADLLAEIQSQRTFDNLDDMFYWDADKGCTSSPAGKPKSAFTYEPDLKPQNSLPKSSNDVSDIMENLNLNRFNFNPEAKSFTPSWLNK